jgi:hypothetical protein
MRMYGYSLVNDQLDPQFFSIYLFQFSACFEQSRAHHQENQLHQYIWCMSLCRWPFRVQVGPTCTRYGHRHRVTYTRGCIDTVDSPDDEHEIARNMQRIEIKYVEKNCGSSWSFTKNHNEMHGQQNIKLWLFVEVFHWHFSTLQPIVSIQSGLAQAGTKYCQWHRSVEHNGSCVPLRHCWTNGHHMTSGWKP